MNSLSTKTQPPLEKFQLLNKPTLIITKRLQENIAYAHERAGSREWSGELITSERGKITDLDNWTIIAEDMFLVDIGSGAFTGYEVDKGGFKAADIIELYEAFPGLEEGTHKNHHIHTHHTMGAFMSGTDWENLNDRGILSNYFMMLVVDTKAPYDWVAHVGFPAKIKQQIYQRKVVSDMTIDFANNLDAYPSMIFGVNEKELVQDKVTEKTVLCVMECNIVKEAMCEQQLNPFQERYKRVASVVSSPLSSASTTYPPRWDTSRPGTIPQLSKSADSPTSEEKRYGSRQLGRKKGETKKQRQQNIMNMTEQEWNQSQEPTKGPYRFDHRHARGLLNAYIGIGTIEMQRMDFKDPISGILDYIRQETSGEIASFVEFFIPEMISWLESNFPQFTDEEYLSFLNNAHEYLKPFQFYPIIKKLCEQVDMELERFREELIIQQNKNEAEETVSSWAEDGPSMDYNGAHY